MPHETILLLGIKPESAEDAREMRMRCEGAVACLALYPQARVIVCGGQTGALPVTEAEAMRLILSSLGVSPERIVLEDASVMTMENIVNALSLLDEAQRQNLWLVTSDYHMPRARLTLKRCGFRARSYCVKTPLSLGKIRKLLFEGMYTIDLLLGYQDPKARRPAWTRALMRLLGQNKP